MDTQLVASRVVGSSIELVMNLDRSGSKVIVIRSSSSSARRGHP
jgi:hypothetical protein